jgi:hypothetical protein
MYLYVPYDFPSKQLLFRLKSRVPVLKLTYELKFHVAIIKENFMLQSGDAL